MRQIINFIVRYKTFLLYIFLLTIAIGFTIQSHSYHQSRFFNSSNYVSGSIYKTSSNFFTYFDLKKENEKLVQENKRLRDILFNLKVSDSITLDSVQKTYTIATGEIVKNSFAKPRNYITINKGQINGILPDMGVITDKGILGIIENTSNNFSTVQSILNENSNINAKIKGTNQFGSLVWNKNSYRVVQLIDIPRMAQITIGDTIVTGGMSSIFPENIPIGTIQKYSLDTSNSFYKIDVNLFNDMTNLRHVYIIQNKDRIRIINLQKQTKSND